MDDDWKRVNDPRQLPSVQSFETDMPTLCLLFAISYVVQSKSVLADPLLGQHSENDGNETACETDEEECVDLDDAGGWDKGTGWKGTTGGLVAAPFYHDAKQLVRFIAGSFFSIVMFAIANAVSTAESNAAYVHL